MTKTLSCSIFARYQISLKIFKKQMTRYTWMPLKLIILMSPWHLCTASYPTLGSSRKDLEPCALAEVIKVNWTRAVQTVKKAPLSLLVLNRMRPWNCLRSSSNLVLLWDTIVKTKLSACKFRGSNSNTKLNLWIISKIAFSRSWNLLSIKLVHGL